MENRPFKKQTIEMYVGCLKSASKSPTQHSKLIASPSLTSKFSPSQFLSNSPCIKQKKLKDKNGLNIFEQFNSKKAADKRDNLIKLCSNTNEDNKAAKVESESNIGPTRKNMAFLKNLEKDSIAKPKKNFDENDPMFSLQEGKNFEAQGVNIINSNNDAIIKDEDEPHEIIQYAGSIFKITETNKLKKLWFKLYDKDLFCKPNIL